MALDNAVDRWCSNAHFFRYWIRPLLFLFISAVISNRKFLSMSMSGILQRCCAGVRHQVLAVRIPFRSIYKQKMAEKPVDHSLANGFESKTPFLIGVAGGTASGKVSMSLHPNNLRILLIFSWKVTLRNDLDPRVACNLYVTLVIHKELRKLDSKSRRHNLTLHHLRRIPSQFTHVYLRRLILKLRKQYTTDFDDI